MTKPYSFLYQPLMIPTFPYISSQHQHPSLPVISFPFKAIWSPLAPVDHFPWHFLIASGVWFLFSLHEENVSTFDRRRTLHFSSSIYCIATSEVIDLISSSYFAHSFILTRDNARAKSSACWIYCTVIGNPSGPIIYPPKKRKTTAAKWRGGPSPLKGTFVCMCLRHRWTH